MALCTRSLLVLVAIAAHGCITGHLLDETRRYERPLAYREAALDDDRLMLRYSAIITDQFANPTGETVERRVAIPVARFAGRAACIDPRPGGAGPHGRPIPVRADAPCSAGVEAALTVAEIAPGETDLVLCTPGGPLGPLASSALVRTRTPLWVYPLVPVTAALDAAIDPVLLFFAPAVMVTGE